MTIPYWKRRRLEKLGINDELEQAEPNVKKPSTLTVSCNIVNMYGMGIDFTELKEFIRQIETHYDHKTILDKDDELVEYLKIGEYVTTAGNPTCETIAKEIFEWAQKHFWQGVAEGKMSIVNVIIKETCTTTCTYTHTSM
jgi:6-pyruvoyl-tetrahydropterin synthase